VDLQRGHIESLAVGVTGIIKIDRIAFGSHDLLGFTRRILNPGCLGLIPRPIHNELAPPHKRSAVRHAQVIGIGPSG
jgi:hypothetical protein